MTSDAEREIERFLYRYARVVDEQRFHDWLDLFTDDATYSVMTYENARDQGLYLFKDAGKEAPKERAAYLLGYWQAPRGKTLHVFSNIDVNDMSDGQARVKSYFVVYRTGGDGNTQLQACGQSDDTLVREDERWRFKNHAVVVDNDILPPNFTELF